MAPISLINWPPFHLTETRIGRTGKILGCRTLTVLHDPAGHPLLATTARGDAHLTTTVPALLDQSPRGYPGRYGLLRPDHHH